MKYIYLLLIICFSSCTNNDELKKEYDYLTIQLQLNKNSIEMANRLEKEATNKTSPSILSFVHLRDSLTVENDRIEKRRTEISHKIF